MEHQFLKLFVSIIFINVIYGTQENALVQNTNQIKGNHCMQTNDISSNEYRCYHINSTSSLIQHVEKDVEKLEIHNSLFNQFLSSALVELPNLKELTFVNCYIGTWSDVWPKELAKIKKLTFNSTYTNRQLFEFEPEVWKNMNFDVIKFTDGNLAIKNIGLNFTKEILIDDVYIECTDMYIERNREKILFTLIDSGKLSYTKKTKCYYDKTAEKYDDKTVIEDQYFHVMFDAYKEAKDLCNVCKCEISQTGIVSNCTGKGYKNRLPNVPYLTHYVILSYNKITNIDDLHTNPRYPNTMKVLLNHNNIQEYHATNFENIMMSKKSGGYLLDLSFNNLTWFPISKVMKVLEYYNSTNTSQMIKFYLEGNLWPCDDCNFILEFQKMLLNYPKSFDIHKISCRDKVESNNIEINEAIFGKDFTKQCQPMKIEILDWICIVISFFIALNIFFMVYSYHLYSNYSRLPFQDFNFPSLPALFSCQDITCSPSAEKYTTCT